MNRFAWLLIASAAGCINGAPLPPTPTSSLTPTNVAPDREQQEAEYVQIAQTYMRGLGKDPTQATYQVRQNPRRDEEQDDEAATAAIVDVNYLNGNVWHLAVKENGDIAPLTKY
ncbi:MAG TPA: hypothetical protein VNH11_02630 [Pirellulales bacterium]|nr:hypothetical protein [Pirellulales bacterium]